LSPFRQGRVLVGDLRKDLGGEGHGEMGEGAVGDG